MPPRLHQSNRPKAPGTSTTPRPTPSRQNKKDRTLTTLTKRKQHSSHLTTHRPSTLRRSQLNGQTRPTHYRPPLTMQRHTSRLTTRQTHTFSWTIRTLHSQRHQPTIGAGHRIEQFPRERQGKFATPQLEPARKVFSKRRHGTRHYH